MYIPDERILQTTNVLAESATQVLDPVMQAVMNRSARRRIPIRIYRKSDVLSEALCKHIAQLISEMGVEDAVQLEYRPWNMLWFLPLLKGAWHVPILEINGQIYSEGVVPEKDELKRYIQSLLI